MRYLPLFIVSIISGYLYVNWLPIPSTITVYSIIMEFVLNPVKFFAATISFFIGFITNGIFIRGSFLQLKSDRKYKGKSKFEPIINVLSWIITCFLLMRLGFWQMSIFFSFAIVYGMMTFDKNK